MPLASPLRMLRPALVLAALSGLSAAARAHPGHDSLSGFASGALHPLSGADHLAAMVAVGLWAALLGGRALRALPVAFPVAMAVGGALGMAGVALPNVELAIAASAIALGLLVAGAVRLPLAVAAALVGTFALFHGHAHGAELPEAANALAYAAGFLVSTVALHGLGVALGVGVRRFAAPRAHAATRLIGTGIAATGVALLVA